MNVRVREFVVERFGAESRSHGCAKRNALKRSTTNVAGIAALLCSSVVLAAEGPLVTVPHLAQPPVIDGAIDSREWLAATILPPLAREADGIAEGFRTRVHLGWTDDSLFVGIHHRRPPNAMLVDDPVRSLRELRNSDHVKITLPGTEGKKVELLVWGETVVLDGQPCESAGRMDAHAWQSEIRIPWSRLGGKRSELNIGVRLDEPSVTPEPQTLRARVQLDTRPVTFRFLDAAEFEGGHHQGAMAELINTDAQPKTARLDFFLTTPGGASRALTNTTVALPADARRRVRLAVPSIAGACRVTYDVVLDEKPYAMGEYAFETGGPVRVEVLKFFLLRGGVFVRSQLTVDALKSPGTNATVSVECALSDARTGKVLSTTSATADSKGSAEQFVNTEKLKPGPYEVLVTATRDGEVLAKRRVPLTKPETPKWWRPRRAKP
jgi:hypothetical protein